MLLYGDSYANKALLKFCLLDEVRQIVWRWINEDGDELQCSSVCLDNLKKMLFAVRKCFLL